MNKQMRTRVLAVLTAGTLVGVLGGTGVASAGHPAAPQADDRLTTTCQSVGQAEKLATSTWYGYGLSVAV